MSAFGGHKKMKKIDNDLENNRFVRWWGGVTHKKTTYFLIFLVLFAVIEVFSSVAFVTIKTGFRGTPLVFYGTRYHLTNLFTRNAVTEQTAADYVGDYAFSKKAARRWHVADPVLGWRLGKNVGITKAIDLMPGIQDRRFHKITWRITNAQGFASAGKLKFDTTVKKEAGTFRVIMLGGSTMEGDGSELVQHNLPSKFNEVLARLPVPEGYQRYEVINAGVGGYTSGQEYLYLVTDLVQYEPDLVIVYDGWNDFNSVGGSSVRPPFLRMAKHNEYAERLNASYTPWGAFSSLVTATGNEVYEALRSFVSFYIIEKAFKLVIPPGSNETKANRDPQEIEAGVAAYRDNLERILLTARQYRFSVGLFLQPILGVDGKEPAGQETYLFEREPEALENRRIFYAKARSMFAELDRTWGNPSSCIRDISRVFENNRAHLYADTGHLMEPGNAIVASGLAGALLGCGILPSRP